MKKTFVISGVVILAFSYTLCIFSQGVRQKKSFLVAQDGSPNRASKNELKENIGEELKQALYACTAIATELSNVQRELASLQHRILSRVENLVEQKREFKKARRKELSDAYDIIVQVKNQLSKQKEMVKNIALKMDKNRCLKA